MQGSIQTQRIRRRRRRGQQVTHPGIPGADNRWFPSQGQARAAALRAATQMGPGVSIAHDPRPVRGQPHYHVVDTAGRRVSGHFFYGRRKPRKAHRDRPWREHESGREEMSRRTRPDWPIHRGGSAGTGRSDPILAGLMRARTLVTTARGSLRGAVRPIREAIDLLTRLMRLRSGEQWAREADVALQQLNGARLLLGRQNNATAALNLEMADELLESAMRQRSRELGRIPPPGREYEFGREEMSRSEGNQSETLYVLNTARRFVGEARRNSRYALKSIRAALAWLMRVDLKSLENWNIAARYAYAALRRAQRNQLVGNLPAVRDELARAGRHLTSAIREIERLRAFHAAYGAGRR